MTQSSLQWIRMECVPLPDAQVDECVVYWNPVSREIVGEQSDFILSLVEAAQRDGYIKSPTLNHFEITDPLTKPSELAAILGQFFWVIPQPVEAPDSVDVFDRNPSDLLQ